MANPSIMQKIDKMSRVYSMTDLAYLIDRYPELCLNKYGFASLCRHIPRIVRQSEQDTICCRFVWSIVEQYRARAMASRDLTAYASDYHDGNSDADWALQILRIYMDALVAKTGGNCFLQERLAHSDLKSIKMRALIGEGDSIPNRLFYLGWILFLPNYASAGAKMSDAVIQYLMSNREFLDAFLKVFIDMTTPTASRDEIALLMSTIWSQYNINQDWVDDTGVHTSYFGDRCGSQNVGWITEIAHNEHGDDPVLRDPAAYEEFINLFINLSNLFETNRFSAENYFFEYLAKIAYEYPLDAQRLAISAKYEPYFHSYAYIMVVQFVQDVIENFGNVKDYKTKPAIDIAQNRALRKAEDMVYFIRRAFPDVDASTVYGFFDELCRAFGRGFTGASTGLLCTLEPMIHKIFRSDEETIASESDLSYANMLSFYAMEGSYGDSEDVTESKSSSGNQRSNRDDDAPKTTSRVNNLHKRARSDESAMQAGERKIYNAYKKYKNAEEQVDSTLQKGIAVIKRALAGDQAAVIIEGKKFSPIGFLKKAILTIGIFNYSKIAAILFLIVSNTLKKKANQAERRRLLSELESELQMINEKIEDARGDGNRQAKYDLMRTKQAYENAIRRIKFGLSAEVQKEKISDTDRQYLRSTQQNRGSYSG